MDRETHDFLLREPQTNEYLGLSSGSHPSHNLPLGVVIVDRLAGPLRRCQEVTADTAQHDWVGIGGGEAFQREARRQDPETVGRVDCIDM